MKLYKRYKKSAERSPGSVVEMGKLTVADTDAAERTWIKDAQELIAKEVQAGKLVILCPKYKDEMIFVGGRLGLSGGCRLPGIGSNSSFFLITTDFHSLLPRMSTGKVDTLVSPRL